MMDPRTGELFTLEQIKDVGTNTESDLVLVEGKKEDILHISEVLKSNWSKSQKQARNAKNKRAKASRKKNR